MSDPTRPTLAARVARARWRAAEDRLYPALISDPSGYQRAVQAIQTVVRELRTRVDDLDGLLVAEAAPDELLAAAGPGATAVPADLLVAVACATRDREMAAETEGRRRSAVVDAARAAGSAWAVLDGPVTAEELTEGRRTALHLASGTVVAATVDPWARDDAFGLEVTPGDGGDASSHTFTDRDGWLAGITRVCADIESRSPAP